MKSELVKSYQRSMARLRRIYKPYAAEIYDDIDAEIKRLYRAKRAEALSGAMQARDMDKAWTKAMYPRTYQKEYPND